MAQPMHRSLVVVIACAILVLPAEAALARCDTVTHATALADARTAIDGACPCAAASKPSEHVLCASRIVGTRIADGLLDKSCKSEALVHAKKSICGRPGAVVCCRLNVFSFKTSHRIAKDPLRCTGTPKIIACESPFPSVPTGCDAQGACIMPVCGNGVVEPGETCDPPSGEECDFTCHHGICGFGETDCGNGTLDPGEACEPPGVGTCNRDCQPAPCAAAEPGEIAVACAAAGATIAVGSGGADYLVGWDDLAARDRRDVLVRRFATDGTPVDSAARVVSYGLPCADTQSVPAIGGNGNGYVVTWSGSGVTPHPPGGGNPYRWMLARPYDGTGTLGTRRTMATGPHTVSFECATSVANPTVITAMPAAGANMFITLWQGEYGCSGVVVRDPDGALLEDAGGSLAQTDIGIGYPGPGSPPTTVSSSAASVAALPGDTLAVWRAYPYLSAAPPTTVPFMAAAWVASNGTSSPFQLSSTAQLSSAQPGLAAAADRFLVAWFSVDASSVVTIRGMRVTHTDGPLDPDGGAVLATAGGNMLAGPVVAFDGAVWLVAWAEVGAGGNDLRAVAVQPDGTVVDAVPRLLASGVSAGTLAIASAGDGRSLLVYVRDDGGNAAVRARFEPGL